MKESTVINKLKHSPSVPPVLNVWEGCGGNGSDEYVGRSVCNRDVWMGIPRHSWRGSTAATPPSLSAELGGPSPLLSQEEHNYLWIKQGSCLLPETPGLQVGWLHNCTELQHESVPSPLALPPAVTPLVQTPFPRQETSW